VIPWRLGNQAFRNMSISYCKNTGLLFPKIISREHCSDKIAVFLDICSHRHNLSAASNRSISSDKQLILCIMAF